MPRRRAARVWWHPPQVIAGRQSPRRFARRGADARQALQLERCLRLRLYRRRLDARQLQALAHEDQQIIRDVGKFLRAFAAVKEGAVQQGMIEQRLGR